MNNGLVSETGFLKSPRYLAVWNVCALQVSPQIVPESGVCALIAIATNCAVSFVCALIAIATFRHRQNNTDTTIQTPATTP